MKALDIIKKAAGISVVAAGIAILSGLGTMEAQAAPQIKEVEYDGYGEVDVDFFGKVQYRKLKITVKDTAGKTYKVRITDVDDDDLEFKIVNYKKNKTYTFTISGVKQRGETSFGKVTGKVKIPKTGWVKKGGNWYYVEEDGDYADGWEYINGKWYYFNKRGVWIKNATRTRK